MDTLGAWRWDGGGGGWGFGIGEDGGDGLQGGFDVGVGGVGWCDVMVRLEGFWFLIRGYDVGLDHRPQADVGGDGLGG